MIESCKGCALAPKSPTTTCNPWPNTDHPWPRIHADFAGPLDNMYYLIIVDSHSKWPEVLQCKKPTTNCTIGFLFELFARFGVVDYVVTDNDTQFTSSEFRDFCKTYQVDHITTPQYHPRSNCQPLGTPMDRALQQFLQMYKITTNPNTPMGRSPAETMFARKVKSISDKLIPRQVKFKKTVSPKKKYFYPGYKFLFKAYKNNTFCEVGTIKQRIGELVYIVQERKNTHKRYMNQLRKCR